MCFPALCLEGAKSGLLLWFETILPTLLPFLILSDFLVACGFTHALTRALTPLFQKFPILPASYIYPLIAGYLFGFPMGSKAACDLYKNGEIDDTQLERLVCTTNNISPVFLISYVAGQCAAMPSFAPVLVSCCYVPPLFYLLLIEHFSPSERRMNTPAFTTDKQAPRPQISFQIVDACIMNAFETITKIGGYIILFSIFISLFGTLPNVLFKDVLILFTEITCGIRHISTHFNMPLCLPAYTACSAFGGLCGAAQTGAVTCGTPVNIKRYLLTKLALAAASTAACVIILYLCHVTF
jgi:sporulation integral membrane protein YlbJ